MDSRTTHDNTDDGGMTVIDCDSCTRQGSAVCEECVVSFICGREPDDAVVIDVATERAVRLMAKVGLVPTLKHQQCGPSSEAVSR